MTPPLKPITGWPGYFISKDGEVFIFSTRDNIARHYKPVKVRKDGKVVLTRPGRQKYFKPADLVAEAWRPRWYDKPTGAIAND